MIKNDNEYIFDCQSNALANWAMAPYNGANLINKLFDSKTKKEGCLYWNRQPSKQLIVRLIHFNQSNKPIQKDL